ncbi:MAG: 2-hydroxychromene-2-carboxylate isomerase [Pseudomonadales bacterium]
MSKSIEFYFDFGSPTSYLAHHRLKAVAKQFNVGIDYKPVLLGGIFKATGNASPITVPAKGNYMFADLQRYAKMYGVQLEINPFFPINTITLMRGAVAALQLDNFSNYVDTLFDAMWSTPVNLGDLEVLQQVFTDAGLDTEAILTLSQNDSVKEELKQRTSDAVERGLFGCPTMFVDGEMFFGQDRIFFIEKMLDDKPK